MLFREANLSFFIVMKNSLITKLSLFAFLFVSVFVLGCKDTATTPGFVNLAQIRFANFHQVEPIQVYMYPDGALPDTISKTQTPLTYGIVTPYLTNLATNREAGQLYHLIYRIPGNPVIQGKADVVLKPNDRKTWLIGGDKGNFDEAVIDDAPPSSSVQDSTHAYYRFLNVNPDLGPLNCMIGDPLLGQSLAQNVAYKTVSPYVAIQTAFDTTVTFYITNATGTVLGRLSGVALQAATFHTITWGGQDPSARTRDANGNKILDDSLRVRILDDNEVGNDATVPVPSTFRFNIINALIPPNYPNATTIDYVAAGGLNIIIQNNTVYDYKKLKQFSLAPAAISTNGDGVASVVPITIPLVDVIYFKFVKPAAYDDKASPGTADINLFRFYAGPKSSFKSDFLNTVIVYDTVKKVNPAAAAPFDSAQGTITIQIPDVPIAGKARLVFGNMLAPIKGAQTANVGVFSINDVVDTKVKAAKSFNSNDSLNAGSPVTLKGVVNSGADTFTATFTPEAGAIYEAFLVGQRGHVNSDYRPKFMIVRLNPK